MPKSNPTPPQPAKMDKDTSARWVIATLARSLINLELPIEFPYASCSSATYIKQEIWATWRQIRREDRSEKPLPKITQAGNVLKFTPAGKETGND